ncbi:MAG TPA: TolC family protein [Thermoanaerobaculia bacterium]|nr:TolC family protein [Thermoanaerobaculia bacterium]
MIDFAAASRTHCRAGRSRRGGAKCLVARTLGAAAIAVLLAAASAAGESLRLSLREAVARALSEGTAARIAYEAVETSSAQAKQARSALLPQVIGEVQDSNEILNLRTFGLTLPGVPSLVGPFNVFDAHVTVAARIIDVAAYRRYQAARQGIAVAGAEKEKTENDVAAAVATLYVALQRAQADVDATQANVDLFTKLRDLAEDQRKAGVATRLDSTRAEVALARQNQALLVQLNRRDAARLALLHAIGADQELTVELTDALQESPPPMALARDEVSAALTQRPELKALDEQIRAADLTIAARSAERLPSLVAQFQGGYNGNHLGDLDWNRVVGAGVSVPVFTGGRIPAEIAEQKSRRRELALQRTETERQVEEDVRRALLTVQNAIHRVEVARDNVRLANDELDFARDRFANGVSSSIEVDNAQNSYATARADHISALADQAQARFDLARATGRIRDLIETKETQ